MNPDAAPVTIETTTTLTAGQIAAVDDLVAGATEADDVAPLNEEAELRLHADEPAEVWHVRATSDTRLVGYAMASAGDDTPGEPVVVEGVVAPDFRRRGIGARLGAAVLAETDDRQVLAWAHGDLRGSEQLAASSGFERVRVLLRMEAALSTPLEERPPPDDVTVRTFRPGDDDAAWLALNAKAFADHPEQGSMTQRDLDLRIASDWFDPDGFFLAERDGSLVGFHWTKVVSTGSEPVGEVYVVGVDPDAQGTGLGALLTARGLAYLQNRGVRTVELYVEGDNAPALAVYRRLGFAEAGRDVMYRRS